MAGQRGHLTAQQEQFARLVVEQGHSFVSAYRVAYPPRNGTRSAGAERVAARRVAHHPAVELRMEQLREEILASDPVELRRKATGTLARILSGKTDPGLRLAAISTLRYLDAQERAAARNDREALRTISDQLAALDALEDTAKRASSTTVKPPLEERPPANIDQIIDEIAALISEQRLGRDLEPPPIPVLESAPDFARHAAEGVIPVQATPAVEHVTTPQSSGSRLIRKAGTFGKPVWIRQPDPR